MALVVGTAASLTANVAVGGADLVGKTLAGWPALSMLVSVKLLSAMFDHEKGDDHRTIVRDDQRTSGTVPDVPEIVRKRGRDDAAPSATVPADRPTDPTTPPAPGGTGHPVGPAAPVDVRTVAHLMPAARAAASPSPRLACHCRGTTLRTSCATGTACPTNALHSCSRSSRQNKT